MKTADSPLGPRAANVRRRTRQLAAWTGAWLVTLAVASFGPTLVWEAQTLTILAIGANVIVGLMMIAANKAHLQSLDELQQKIQLEAMGITLGLGLVVGLAYSAMDIANLIQFDAQIAHLVMYMGVTYLVSLLVLRRKYL